MIRELQRNVWIWANENFKDRKPHQPALGVVEEIGELFVASSRLCHGHLKGEQNIRHTQAEIKAQKEDAVGDIIIYLADYCNLNGIDMQVAITKTWDKVKKRNWNKEPMGPSAEEEQKWKEANTTLLESDDLERKAADETPLL